jgi:hypothetical protein
MTTRGPVLRWRALVAEHGGPGLAALYLLHRLLQRASGGQAALVPYLLVAQPVSNPVLAAVKADPGTVVERVGPGHPVLAQFPRPQAVINQRFAQGDECHVAWVKGAFAGYIWLARGRYVEDEVRCVFEIAEPALGVWDYDVYVEPRLRLGRTMARLWKAVDEVLAAEGVAWSFSRINRFNGASVKAHQRLGAETTGKAFFLQLGSLQAAWLPAAPYVHLSVRGAGPQLPLRAPTATGA